MVEWDPDGAGPLGAHVVCGGEFAFAGTAATANIALYEPVTQTWSPLGTGFDGPVRALTVLMTGELVAGGAFTHSGTAAVARVAMWNGAAWVGLGSGIGAAVTDVVTAMAALPSGELVVGGAFAVAGGSPAINIARWNGTLWSPLGSGLTGAPAMPAPPPTTIPVTALAVRSGNLIASGFFASAGGTPAHCIASWNGSTWTSLGLAPVTLSPDAMIVLANDDVVVSRSDHLGTADAVRWDGVAWTAMGNNLAFPCSAFCQLANGTLLGSSVGAFTALGELLEWTGLAWVPYPTQGRTDLATVLLELAPNELMLASMTRTHGVPTVQRLSNSLWRAPAAGLDGAVSDIAAAADQVVIGGWFQQVASTPATGIAVRRSGVWSALGGGVDGNVNVIHRATNGDWIVGGWFTQAGTVAANHIARWDGAMWHALGDPGSEVLAIVELPTGEIVVGTDAWVLRWNGTHWGVMAPFGARSLAVLPNGDIVAGTVGPGPKVLRHLGGGTWSALGTGLPGSTLFESIDELRVLANGDLLAGGSFGSGPLTLPANLARWNGVAWTVMGQGVLSHVTDIDVLPNGDWLVTHVGRDWSNQPHVSPSRWNGTTWTPVSGLDVAPWQQVESLAIDDFGEILVAGTFGSVQGTATGGIASLVAGCPASAVQVGAGCMGSAGPVVMHLQSRPWLGDAYRSRTTGLPAGSLAVAVFGLTTVTLPLASVLPQGLVGCTLHVSPDFLTVALPVASEVATTLPIPIAPVLLLQSFHHQVVPFELSATGAITGISSSDALRLTIGAW